MSWSTKWEYEDVYQELCLFWLKKKQSGWMKPEDGWQGAMGWCLLCHLKNLQKKECLENKRRSGFLSSLDALINEGFDIEALDKTPISFDPPVPLNTPDRMICDLLTQGQSKKAIAQKLKVSRFFVHRRVRYVRHLAEEKV